MTQADGPVLVYAPLAGDAAALAESVEARGLSVEVCATREAFADALAGDALCAIVSQEGAATLTLETLKPALADAPSWSTIPLIFIVSDAGHPPRICIDLLSVTPPATAVVLARPVRPATLQLVLENQVQMRRRQFQTADLLRQLEQSERRQAFLFSELKHRTYNMLSVIQAKIRMTASQHETVESFVSALSARIQAMAEAHRRLLESDNDETRLRSLLSAQIEPYRREGNQLEIDGPEVLLGDRVAFDIALIVHELATNAAKYGAFSVDGGLLEVRWRLAGGALALRWTETGGPAVEPPRQRSFGTQMVEQLLARYQGVSRLDFRPAGLVWTLRLPVAELDKAHPA